MTILHPCLHCHRRESCEVRKAKAKAIAGARLTVARFRCSLAEPDFPPGCRVTAILTSYGEGNYAYGEDLRRTNRPVAGTVMRWAQGRVVVLFDEPITLASRLGEAGVRVLKLPSRRLKPLEEAPRELCACDFPKAADGSCALPEGLVCHHPPLDEATKTAIADLATLRAVGSA